jgi:hypothetical protein
MALRKITAKPLLENVKTENGVINPEHGTG